VGHQQETGFPVTVYSGVLTLPNLSPLLHSADATEAKKHKCISVQLQEFLYGAFHRLEQIMKGSKTGLVIYGQSWKECFKEHEFSS